MEEAKLNNADYTVLCTKDMFLYKEESFMEKNEKKKKKMENEEEK